MGAVLLCQRGPKLTNFKERRTDEDEDEDEWRHDQDEQ